MRLNSSIPFHKAANTIDDLEGALNLIDMQLPFDEVVESFVEQRSGLIRQYIFPGSGYVLHLFELRRDESLEDIFRLVSIPEYPELFPLCDGVLFFVGCLFGRTEAGFDGIAKTVVIAGQQSPFGHPAPYGQEVGV